MFVRKNDLTILHNHATYLTINLKNTEVYLSIEPNEAVIRCKYIPASTGIKNLSELTMSARLARLHVGGNSVSCMFTTRYVYVQMSPYSAEISSHDYMKGQHQWLDIDNHYVKTKRRTRKQEETILVDLTEEEQVRVARKRVLIQNDRATVPLSAESTQYQTQFTLPETDQRKRLTLPKTLCQKKDLDIL